MKITANVELNLKEKEVTQEVKKATLSAMRDTVIEVTNDSVRGSPKLTGNNARSIASEVSGMGVVAGEGAQQRIVDDTKIEGAVFSTSGYGGYLETGTSKMASRPYFKPALDKNFTQEKFAGKVRRYLP